MRGRKIAILSRAARAASSPISWRGAAAFRCTRRRSRSCRTSTRRQSPRLSTRWKRNRRSSSCSRPAPGPRRFSRQRIRLGLTENFLKILSALRNCGKRTQADGGIARAQGAHRPQRRRAFHHQGIAFRNFRYRSRPGKTAAGPAPRHGQPRAGSRARARAARRFRRDPRLPLVAACRYEAARGPHRSARARRVIDAVAVTNDQSRSGTCSWFKKSNSIYKAH